jgi:multicomponent Na+:H+ antiporter subunit F
MILGIPAIFAAPLIVSCFLCLYRALRGPTSADRIVAVDILGILVVGFCALFVIYTPRAFFMDIAIAWALLGFLGALALAKYLEGKKFDE